MIAGYTARRGQMVNQSRAFVGITVSPKCASSAQSAVSSTALLLRASALRMNTLLDEIGNFDGVAKTTTSVALEWKVDQLQPSVHVQFRYRPAGRRVVKR